MADTPKAGGASVTMTGALQPGRGSWESPYGPQKTVSGGNSYYTSQHEGPVGTSDGRLNQGMGVKPLRG